MFVLSSRTVLTRQSRQEIHAVCRFAVIALILFSGLYPKLNFATETPFQASQSAPAGVRLLAESSARASFTFELPPLLQTEVWSDGERFDRFAFEDDPPAGPVGWPELPSMVRLVLIPPGSGVELKVTALRTHTLSQINPVPRRSEPLERDLLQQETSNFGADAEPLFRDTRSLEVTGFWPEETITLGQPAIMRGYRLVPVVIHPVRYNPTTSELQVVDEIGFELDYTTTLNRTNLVLNPEKPRPSPSVDRLIREIVVNPPLMPERDFGVRGGSILYVIGSAEGWDPVLDRLTPLVEWRRKMGWSVEVLRVQDQQDANNVRREIQSYYVEAVNPPEHIVICGDTGGDYLIGYFNHQAGAGYPYESDHDFTLLEGDDLLPEASIGRFPINSLAQLEAVVGKTVRYEANPFIGQDEAARWQKHAAIEALMPWNSVNSPNNICRLAKRLLLNNGYEDVAELYNDENGQNPDNINFVNESFRGGCSIFIHRGQTYMHQFRVENIDDLRNAPLLPFGVITTCNTGDYAEHLMGQFSFSEAFVLEPASGTIAATGCAGATHTAYNNLYLSGTIHSLLVNKLTNVGWAHAGGKLALYAQYYNREDIMHEENRNMEAWLTHYYIMNLMGDPAVDLFTDIPRPLAVTSPEAVRSGESRFEVTVLHDDDDSPALDATVCLYKQDTFQLVATPDAEGRVVFDLEPDWAVRDSVHLTVTGHNLLPNRRSYRIAQAEDFIGAGRSRIDDDNEGGSHGNDDGIANPLETIQYHIDIMNHGENNYDGALNLTLTTANPYLEILEGERQLEWAPGPGEMESAQFLVRIDGGFPAGTNALFELTASAEEHSWISSASLPVAGPEIEFVSLEWNGEMLHRGERAELSITLGNSGEADIPRFFTTLFSRIETVEAFDAESFFESIGPGDVARSESNFSVSAHPFRFGDKPVPMGLTLETGDGIIDTIFFDLPVSPMVDGEPNGPDDYGYLSFGSDDVAWYATPEYNWIEIDPNLGGEGTNTDLIDRDEAFDMSVVVDLPFTFQYYGEDFDQLTISSNGWIAPGDYHEINSARNRKIPGPECPPGLIAPFWEDLITVGGSGVYTWYDEENDWFIVEWSSLKKLGPRRNEEPTETFQVILFDPAEHPSFTGDGDILFQYQTVTDDQSCWTVWDVPFASVGIASPDLLTGIGLTYRNERLPGAPELHDGLAIKFTTLIEYRVGTLRGRVYDIATRQPIADAGIFTTYGFSGLTDVNGEFRIERMLVDSNYTVRASKQFYNDSVQTEVAIREDEETVVEFGLFHPEFRLSEDHENFEMLPDSIAHRDLILENRGNGRLTFNSKYGLVLDEVSDNDGGEPVRDDPDEIWDLLQRIDIADSIGNPRIQAVAFVEDHWLIAASRIGQVGPHKYYSYERDGTFIDEMEGVDSIGGNFGLRDMEYEDGNLWATASDEFLYQLDPGNGQILTQYVLNDRLNSTRCVTRDSRTGRFYVSSTTGSIYVYEFVDDNLAVIEDFYPLDPRDQSPIRKYGFGWFPDDPDDCQLYVIGTNEVPSNVANHADLSIFKINVETQEVRFLTDLAEYLQFSAGGKCGMTITPKWNTGVYAMAVVIEQASHDWLGVFELAPNTSWISYEPRSGALEPGQQLPLVFEINSTGLDTAVYQLNIDITHNASPGTYRLPIRLDVVNELDISGRGEKGVQPLEFSLEHAYPNPFNQNTSIHFSLDANAVTRLKVYDLGGREVVTILDQPMTSGNYTRSFDAKGLASGIYICRLESNGKSAVQKLVLMK